MSKLSRRNVLATLGLLYGATTYARAQAAYPAPREATWVARNFRFHTGEVMPEVRLAYTTVGAPTGIPVLVLHGTAGSAASLLNPAFAGELFGPGQPLDAARYFVILPDALGTGKSVRPSDGLRARFPRYNYTDMVNAQHRLVTEGLGIRRLRLVLGNSMGGMHTWLWGTMFPDMVDTLFPMACLPVAMSGRNHMLRRMLTQAIRQDPDWKGGDYLAQPPNMQRHLFTYALATNGGNLALFKAAPNARAGDAYIAERLAEPFRGDANDVLYQWESSAAYDPSADLGKIKAWVVAVNSADDERNPPELGVMEQALRRIPNARQVLLSLGPDSRGHATTGQARLWKDHLAQLLQQAP